MDNTSICLNCFTISPKLEQTEEFEYSPADKSDTKWPLVCLQWSKPHFCNNSTWQYRVAIFNTHFKFEIQGIKLLKTYNGLWIPQFARNFFLKWVNTYFFFLFPLRNLAPFPFICRWSYWNSFLYFLPDTSWEQLRKFVFKRKRKNRWNSILSDCHNPWKMNFHIIMSYVSTVN